MYLKGEHMGQVTATVKRLPAGRLDEGRSGTGWWRTPKSAVGTNDGAFGACGSLKFIQFYGGAFRSQILTAFPLRRGSRS
jgi:hypothetical protein